MPTENSATEGLSCKARSERSSGRLRTHGVCLPLFSSNVFTTDPTSGHSASQFKPLGDDYRMVARPEIGRLLQTGPSTGPEGPPSLACSGRSAFSE